MLTFEEKMPRYNGIKVERCQCGFRLRRSTTGPNSHSKQIFQKACEYAKEVFACFCDLKKAYDRIL